MNTPAGERTLVGWLRKHSDRPIFAILSVSVPFIGFHLGLGVLFLSPPDTDSGHMGLRDFYRFIAIMFFSFVIGSIASLIALARREKSRKLVFTGLFLSGGPLLWMLSKIIFHG